MHKVDPTNNKGLFVNIKLTAKVWVDWKEESTSVLPHGTHDNIQIYALSKISVVEAL